MPRDLPAADSKIFAFVADAIGAPVEGGARLTALPGGAVLRHFRLDFRVREGRFAGPQSWVLRADGVTPLGIGLPRAQEFAVQHALWQAGLKVAEPLFMCCDEAVFGAPFFLMRYLPGESDGEVLVAQGPNERLAEALGAELAKLHALDLARALRFLGAPPEDAAAARIVELERHLATDGAPHPVAAWALRWLKRHKPAAVRPVLVHGDFRTGNYRVERGALAGVLDWDFAGWSDPAEDIAWFCAKAWRFGAFANEAGGIAPRAAFYRGYEAVSGRRIDSARVHYCEVMAALRWLVIALKQRDRFLRRGERALDLALTGRRPAECEFELLLLIDESRSQPPHQPCSRDLGWLGTTRSAATRCPRGFDRKAIERVVGRASEQEMRDQPSGAELARLAQELGGDAALIARCHAIAAREESAGQGAFAAIRATLAARYGAGDDHALVASLVEEMESGNFDAPGDARDWARRVLWDLTRQKLRLGNPEFLAAHGLD